MRSGAQWRNHHGTEYHAAGNHVQRGKEPACRSALPDFPAGRLSRRALQEPEHGAQFLHHKRRRRNGPGAGRAGGGLRHGARRAHEPDPSETNYRRRQSGHCKRAGARQHARDGVLRKKARISAGRDASLRIACGGERRDRHRGRGQSCRNQPQAGRFREHGVSQARGRAGASHRRH